MAEIPRRDFTFASGGTIFVGRGRVEIRSGQIWVREPDDACAHEIAGPSINVDFELPEFVGACLANLTNEQLAELRRRFGWIATRELDGPG